MNFIHPEIIAVLIVGYGSLMWILLRSLSQNEVLKKRVEILERDILFFRKEIKEDVVKINQKLDEQFRQMIEILKDKNKS